MKKILSAVLALMTAAVWGVEFSDADIVLPPKANAYMKYAAQELSTHLKMITGGKFRITAAPASKVRIMLGRLPAGFDRKKIAKRDSFAIIAKGNLLYIAGNDTYNSEVRPYNMITHDRASRGTMAAVHTFLEDQGVRWLAPGSQKNTWVSRKKSIKVPEGVKLEAPAVEGRCIADIYNFGESFMKDGMDGVEYIGNEPSGGHKWALRNRYSRNSISNGHSEQMLKLGRLWPKNPERFQLMKNGKRNVNYLCWTDPAVLDIWMKAADAYFSGKTPAAAGLTYTKNWRVLGCHETFVIDAMDHGSSNDGRCRCKRCAAHRKKYPCADDSEIMWQVIGKVAQMVKKKYPGKYVSTLVYPPKQFYPKSVKLPDNIRVVVCLPGPRKINDAKNMKKQLDTLRFWNKKVGRENLAIWTYQCELFGGKLPGVPEMYPEYFQRYMKQVLPLVCGVYHEYHAHNLTYRVLETYLQTKILWNPNVDVKKLKEEHTRLYYGPAAKVMGELLDRLEKNWGRYEKMSRSVADPGNQIGVYRDYRPMKKRVWGEIYNKKEMELISSMLTRAEKLAGKSVYGERVERFRRLIYNVMVKERAEVMDLADLAPVIELNAAPWEKQKSYKLLSAHRDGTALKTATTCQFRVDKNVFYARIKTLEPRMDLVKITPSMKNGSNMIWQDYCWEFFFYTPADNAIRQYMISAGSKSCKGVISAAKNQWTASDVKYTVKKVKGGFILDFAMPFSCLGKSAKDFKFNVGFERNMKKIDPEYGTLSAGALLGNWHNPDGYAKVKKNAK